MPILAREESSTEAAAVSTGEATEVLGDCRSSGGGVMSVCWSVLVPAESGRFRWSKPGPI